MFIRLFSRFFAPDPDPAGGGGGAGGGTPAAPADGGTPAAPAAPSAGGLMADALKPAAPAPIKPDDARTFLTDWVNNPDDLKGMPDDKLLALHGKVTTALDKAKSAGKLDKRPDWLPEQFWDDAKKEIKHESMAKSWTDFRQKISGGTAAPKTPDEYKLELPEGVTVADDKLVGEFRKAAHSAGLSQDAFNKVVNEVVKSGVLDIQPVDTAAELAKLGPQGQAMVNINTAWGKQLVESGVWDQQDFAEMVILGSTAEGIRAFNKLREYYGGEKIPMGDGTGASMPSIDAWYAKHGEKDASGRLKMETDPVFRKQVEDEGKLLFGTEPARTSPTGAGMPR